MTPYIIPSVSKEFWPNSFVFGGSLLTFRFFFDILEASWGYFFPTGGLSVFQVINNWLTVSYFICYRLPYFLLGMVVCYFVTLRPAKAARKQLPEQ